MEKSAPEIRTRIEASPVLPFKGLPFAAQPVKPGWASGAVSGIAVDRKGTIYEIQRGEKADPIVVLDRNGIVLRSWGKGDFKIPHSIRIDPVGNVWTVDAGFSKVNEYSPLGKKLRTIIVGGQPNNGSPFDGTTDVAFAPDGHIFITDGYGNARVLEYTKAGDRVRVWGKPGSAPGEFNLPHSIQITADGIIYVAVGKTDVSRSSIFAVTSSERLLILAGSIPSNSQMERYGRPWGHSTSNLVRPVGLSSSIHKAARFWGMPMFSKSAADMRSKSLYLENPSSHSAINCCGLGSKVIFLYDVMRGKRRRGNVFCCAAGERGPEARLDEGAGRNQHGFSLRDFGLKRQGAAQCRPLVDGEN